MTLLLVMFSGCRWDCVYVYTMWFVHARMYKCRWIFFLFLKSLSLTTKWLFMFGIVELRNCGVYLEWLQVSKTQDKRACVQEEEMEKKICFSTVWLTLCANVAEKLPVLFSHILTTFLSNLFTMVPPFLCLGVMFESWKTQTFFIQCKKKHFNITVGTHTVNSSAPKQTRQQKQQDMQKVKVDEVDKSSSLCECLMSC